MPSKRMVPILFSLASSVLVVLALAGCGGSGSPQTTPVSQEQTNKLVIVSRAALTDEEVAQLPEGFVESAVIAGWSRVAGGFEKEVPGANVEISNGTQSVITDAEGRFSLHAESNGDLELIFPEKRVPLPQGERTTSGLSVIKLTKPFGDCCSQHDEDCEDGCCTEDEEHSSGNPHDHSVSDDAPMDGRCNDFNGWWSDGQNYAKNNWRAFRNFLMSDCDRAGAICWSEHFTGKSCWSVHGSGGCSEVIHHPWGYHKHNFPN